MGNQTNSVVDMCHCIKDGEGEGNWGCLEVGTDNEVREICFKCWMQVITEIN